MFRIACLLCVTFGSISGVVFGDKGHFFNDSYSTKQTTLLTNVTTGPRTRNKDTDDLQELFTVTPSLSWWVDFPILPLVFATSDTLPEGNCKKQTRQFLRDLGNSTLWAVQMFDASTKYPDGVINGHTKHLGNFDECYNLRARLPPDEGYPEEEEIEGRYCLIRFRYERMDSVPIRRPHHFTLDFDPNLTAWDVIDDRGDFRRVKRNSVYTALCVPASCSPEEVETALKDPLKKFAESRGVQLETTVKPSLCQARRDSPNRFTTGSKVFCYIVAVLFVIVVGSSWYDSSLYSSEEAAKNYGSTNIFLCFSARRNIRSIFSNSPAHPGLDCIHLIRFFFMSGVIFGHRTMQYYGYPMVDSTYLEKAYTVPSSIAILNGPIIIDGFFGVGGLLLAYGLLKELDRSKRLNFVALILARFMRLTPLYILVVFFHATVFPLMGSGPFWKIKIEQEGEHCATNWWTNLLYINNYVKQKEMCIFQSWYLSVDYHLYIIGLLTLWVFWRLPRKLGYTFLGGLIALGISVPFFITYTRNVQPIYLGFPFMRDVKNDPYFIDYYIKSHMRAGSYMIGVLSGAIIYDHKSSSWRLPKTWSRSLFVLLAVSLSITSQCLGSKYYDPNSELHSLETATYAGLHRAAFALATCSIVVLISIGDGLDFHYKFMTPRWVPPLSRLTYGAFLVHNINQSYDIAVTRSPRIFSIHNIFWDFVPDMVYTFGLSLLLSIAVEGPIRKLTAHMLTERWMAKDLTKGSSVNGGKKAK